MYGKQEQYDIKSEKLQHANNGPFLQLTATSTCTHSKTIFAGQWHEKMLFCTNTEITLNE